MTEADISWSMAGVHGECGVGLDRWRCMAMNELWRGDLGVWELSTRRCLCCWRDGVLVSRISSDEVQSALCVCAVRRVELGAFVGAWEVVCKCQAPGHGIVIAPKNSSLGWVRGIRYLGQCENISEFQVPPPLACSGRCCSNSDDNPELSRL